MARQQLNINIPESEMDLVSRFKEKCSVRNQSMSKTILTLIKDYTDVVTAQYRLDEDVIELVGQHINIAVREALDAAGKAGAAIGEDVELNTRQYEWDRKEAEYEKRIAELEARPDETSAPLPDFFR